MTEREREVVLRLGRGEQRKDVARALGLSESTVKSHASEAYRKLGVGNCRAAYVRITPERAP